MARHRRVRIMYGVNNISIYLNGNPLISARPYSYIINSAVPIRFKPRTRMRFNCINILAFLYGSYIVHDEVYSNLKTIKVILKHERRSHLSNVLTRGGKIDPEDHISLMYFKAE